MRNKNFVSLSIRPDTKQAVIKLQNKLKLKTLGLTIEYLLEKQQNEENNI